MQPHRDSGVPTVDDVAAAAELLRRGGLLAIPTETVYGLAADATNAGAVARIFEVKGRPTTHPLIVHVASADEMPRWAAAVPDAASRLAAKFWPGPLTLVLHRRAGVLDVVTGGLDTVALRVPAHAGVLSLLRALGTGLAAPSANRFGQLSPTQLAHVEVELGPYLDPLRDGFMVGEPCSIGVESTVIDLSEGRPVLLRPGGIPVEAIAECLGAPVAPFAGGQARAPGQLASHYAPRATLLLCAPDEVDARAAPLIEGGLRVAVVHLPGELRVPRGAVARVLPGTASARARNLYAMLRDLDDEGIDAIVVAFTLRDGLDAAVHDRLTRAATPRNRP